MSCYFMSFEKKALEPVFTSIEFQKYRSSLDYLGIATVISLLLQRVGRMDVDCKLKIVGPTF